MLLEELPNDLFAEIVDLIGTVTYMRDYGFAIGQEQKLSVNWRSVLADSIA